MALSPLVDSVSSSLEKKEINQPSSRRISTSPISLQKGNIWFHLNHGP